MVTGHELPSWLFGFATVGFFAIMADIPIFTARKRSLGQGNIFTPVCHSVQGGRGGVRGRVRTCLHAQGACMAGGRAWWWVCMAEGACVAGEGAWQGGICGGGRAWQILRYSVNERPVRILLECILVFFENICKAVNLHKAPATGTGFIVQHIKLYQPIKPNKRLRRKVKLTIKSRKCFVGITSPLVHLPCSSAFFVDVE